MNHKQNMQPIRFGWLILWVLMYLAILILGIFLPNNQLTAFVRLTGILLCFLYVVIYSPHDYWLLLAMGATCIADLILTGNNISPLGVTVFTSAQVFHLLHLATLQNLSIKRNVLIYIAMAICLLTLDTIFDILPRLYLICGIYAILLITNILVSFRYHKAEPTSQRARFAFFGFVLFAGCDLNTIVSYLALAGVLPWSLYGLANFVVWIFYYPSQVLLSNTGQQDKINVSKP